jgi:hypothetical protein
MRVEHEKRFGHGRVKTYLPFCVAKLLENLSFQFRRENVMKELNKFTIDDSPMESIKNFVKLFLLS